MSEHQCLYCPKAYSRERDLRRHVTLKHDTADVERPVVQLQNVPVAAVVAGNAILWDGEPRIIRQKNGLSVVLEGGRRLSFSSNRTLVRKVLM